MKQLKLTLLIAILFHLMSQGSTAGLISPIKKPLFEKQSNIKINNNKKEKFIPKEKSKINLDVPKKLIKKKIF